MDPIGLQAEELDRSQGELEEDTPPSVLGKLIEYPSNPVVVDGELLVLRQSQGRGIDRFDPVTQTVEGVPGDQDVMNEQANGLTVAQRPVSVAVDVFIEDANDSQLSQEELNQRMSAEPVDLEDLNPNTL